MKPAPGMNMAMSFGTAFFTIVSMTKPMMPLTTWSLRSVSFSLISSQAAAGPPLTSATTMSKAVSSPCMIFSPFGPSALTILPRICAQVIPSTLSANLPISGERERLRDVDALERAGEPVDEAGLEVCADAVGEVGEAELARP